jgi:predicted  nucleic acid-binding Zn-ribbon protein
MPPTPPHVSADILRTLHRIHRQLTDLRDRYERGPKRVQATEANVARREAQLAQAQAELKKVRMAADQKQLQLKSGEDKVKDLKRKLNAAASNREYQALKDQILADEMTDSVLADEILEALEKIDQFQRTVKEAEAGLAAARQKAAAVRNEVQTQHPSIEGNLGRLEAELKEAEAALPPAIQEPYQRVVRQRGEDALAAVEGEYCGGCHQHVPLNVCNAILMGRPTFCKTCGRLLYIPEGAAGPKKVISDL